MRAGVIIYNPTTQSLLLIQRIKDGRHYYVIPGGGQENTEIPIQTAQREIAEELGWPISQQDLTFAFKIDNQEREEYYFLHLTSQTELPQIQGEEKERSHTDNRYLPIWVDLHQLSQLNLQPQILISKIISLDLKLDEF